MTITLLNPPRFDTRGLPEGMDPEQLVRYRHSTLSKDAAGFESLLYRLIPFSLVKSFAFAIDPTYRFKVAPSTITAANRTKYRSTASVLLLRNRTRVHFKERWSQESNYKGHSICGSPYLVHTITANSSTVTALNPQSPTTDKLKDTTSRTRLIGSTQGELELFKGELFSPPRTNQWVEWQYRYATGAPADEACRIAGGVPDYEIRDHERWTTTIGPHAATLSASTLESLRTSELAFCDELSAHYAYPLLKGASPLNRDYSLSRNVAELKDLARSMISAKRTADDLKKLWSSLSNSPKLRDNIFSLSANVSKDIPNEYLSFHFGWKQLYRDLQDLTRLPEKLSKRLNFLITRSGKASTYRSERHSLSGVSGVSGFQYDVHDKEFPNPNGLLTKSRIQRESVTRLVISATFDFPPANTPHFRLRFFADKIGLIPRFTDVYNILPWSWLVDWFTGFGNYLELIEEINHDPSLINWGVISSRTKGSLTTEFICDAPTISRFYLNGAFQNQVVNNILYPHTSVYEYECQTRRNVANVLDVRQTTIPSSLSTYQLSILGAILAQRTGDTRPGAFRPRS